MNFARNVGLFRRKRHYCLEIPTLFVLVGPTQLSFHTNFFVFLPRNKIGTEIALYMAKEEGAPYYLI